MHWRLCPYQSVALWHKGSRCSSTFCLVLLLALQGYDTTIIPLVIMIILMSVAALAALVGLLVFHARAAFYARPLNFHADVLHQQ